MGVTPQQLLQVASSSATRQWRSIGELRFVKI